MPLTSYKVVIAKTADELKNKIQSEGLVPVGGVLINAYPGYAAQAAGEGTLDIGTASLYDVAQAATPQELEILVNEKMVNGFQPVGGVQKWNNAFIQVFGRVDGGGGDPDPVQWDQIQGKPAVIASGSNTAEARASIGAGTSNLEIGSTSGTAKAGNWTPPVATATTYGTVKLSTDAIQSVAPNAATATANRSYMVQNTADGQMVVNVPWSDTKYTLPAATTSANGGVKQAATIENATDETDIVERFNDLLLALKSAGIMAT